MTQLTTVKLGFDQIRTMICISSGLLFLAFFMACQTLATPGNSANSTPKQCNKKIETILQEMKKQLTQVQDDINILKGNKICVKGKNRSVHVLRFVFRLLSIIFLELLS